MGERRAINGFWIEKMEDGSFENRGPVAAAPSMPSAIALPVNPVEAAKDARTEERQDRAEARQDARAGQAVAVADRAAESSNRQATVAEAGLKDKSYDNMMKLRSDYDGMPAVKEYRVAIAQMAQALETADDATGDNALTYAYAKAMDPGSVVRESEMAMAGSGDSVFDARAASFKKQFGMDGGGQFSPQIRDRMRREILNKVTKGRMVYDAQRKRYENDAKRYGINPESVIGAHDGEAFRPILKEYNERKGSAAQGQGSPVGPKTVAASGPTREQLDPRTSSQVDSLMNAGAGRASVNAALERAGHPGITLGSFNAAQKWMKDNPGKQYFGSSITKTVPLNLIQRAAGSEAGAFAARASNSALAGIPGALAGAKGQGALDAMAAANPRSALAGDIVGGVMGAFGAEAGAAAALGGRGAAWLAPRLGDAAYGGLTGFNAAQDGEGGIGALKGAGAGLAGGYLGQRAGSAIGSAFRGVQDPAAQLLRGRGVPLTVGQAVGNSGGIGRTVKNIEDALTSVPGVNSLVNARRLEGLEGFNAAAMREMPGHSGQTGSQGAAEAGGLVNQAYGFLDNTRLPIDGPYAVAEAAARQQAPGRFADDIIAQLDETAGYTQTGELAGRDWQSAVRSNRANRSSVAGQPYADRAVGVHNDIEANLMGLAQRQGPAGTPERLGTANALNGQYQTILRALDNGPAQQADEMFTPARLDAGARQGANAFGGRAASIGGNRPFYDLTTAGRSVLPSNVPDSGTATRGLVAGGLLSLGGLAGGSALGGAAGDSQTGAGLGFGTALMLAAGGSRPAQRFLTSALLDRPDLAVTVGNAIRNNARVGGWAGAGTLTPLTIGQ